MSSPPVIGVLSGCGGAGASVFASVLAGVSAKPSFLIDCDPMGGGIDVLLGCEQIPGPRWRQVRVRGGTLDPAVLVDGLPRWQDVSFLAADSADDLDPDAVVQVIDAACLAGPVVLDLPRWPSRVRVAALARCDRVVLVTVAEVRAVTAAGLIAAALDPVLSVVAVRGMSRSLPASRIGQVLGLPVIGELPFDTASLSPAGLDVRKLRRGTRQCAKAVLQSCQDDQVAA